MSEEKDKNKKILAGEILIHEGEESKSMYWLKSGLLVVQKADLDNPAKMITLGNINPGELFGEMSFLDELPRSATVKALTDSEIVEIQKIKYVDILNSQPKWMQILISNLVLRLRKTNDRVHI
jgi:CRP/FNR family cyclic AMP-dependent transcriptional regulator